MNKNICSLLERLKSRAALKNDYIHSISANESLPAKEKPGILGSRSMPLLRRNIEKFGISYLFRLDLKMRYIVLLTGSREVMQSSIHRLYRRESNSLSTYVAHVLLKTVSVILPFIWIFLLVIEINGLRANNSLKEWLNLKFWLGWDHNTDSLLMHAIIALLDRRLGWIQISWLTSNSWHY